MPSKFLKKSYVERSQRRVAFIRQLLFTESDDSYVGFQLIFTASKYDIKL